MSNVEPPGDRSAALSAHQHSWLRVAKQTGNPLLRAPSLRERQVWWLGWSVVTLLSVGLVLITVLVYRHGIEVRGAEARARHQVTATVLGWSDTRVIGNPYLVASQVVVSYPFERGTQQDVITCTESVEPGSTLPVWIDSTGRVVREPRTLWTVGYDTALSGLLGVMTVVSLGLGLRTWFAGWRQRRHLDEWESEWLAFDAGRKQ